MTKSDPNAHCSACGTGFGPEQTGWPRLCPSCKREAFLNPLPVGVLLVPVGKGLLIGRRLIEPARGKLNLPGGYITDGESWQEAAARETQEELNVTVDPSAILLFDAMSNTARNRLLIFGLAPVIASEEDLPPFIPNPETSERLVLREPTELGFPLHTRAMARYFA